MPPAGLSRAIVVISDRVERDHQPRGLSWDHAPCLPEADAALPDVVGGYLERLPLAAINAGLADFTEIWHHDANGDGSFDRETPYLARRVFRLRSDAAPFHSEAMIDFIRQHGAPAILCVWGLGVSEAVLEACAKSVIIYNSIDAPALRVPPEVSQHFDLVLTGAQWQSDIVDQRHPGMATAIMPVGPEFASPQTFFPTADDKLYDVVYVAAAQPYKRHDVLFDALARAPRRLKALCVMGYGEDAPLLRERAVQLGIDVTFVGPPGVPYAEVNRLMNQARIGVVCGVDDGAPAILTEYMLAGLPVVANEALACGGQYILPETGLVAPADRFEHAMIEAIDTADNFSPRQAVLDRWAWPHTIADLKQLLARIASAPAENHAAVPQGGSFEPAVTA